jgi:hypothetical protein
MLIRCTFSDLLTVLLNLSKVRANIPKVGDVVTLYFVEEVPTGTITQDGTTSNLKRFSLYKWM